MIVGCYSMDLYCDSDGEHDYDAHMRTFNGRTEIGCIRKAHKAGWLVRKGRSGKPDRVLCPKHRGQPRSAAVHGESSK